MPVSSASATPSAHASPGDSPSSEAVHDMVCDFITAQAEAEASGGRGWAGYREVFLSAEVQDLIRSRLMAEAGGGAAGSRSDGGSRSPKMQQQQKKKKRKLDDAVATVPAPAAAADEVLWTVCCLDGTTFSVALPDHARVAEAKPHMCEFEQLELAHNINV
jgi:hypothetical protein